MTGARFRLRTDPKQACSQTRCGLVRSKVAKNTRPARARASPLERKRPARARTSGSGLGSSLALSSEAGQGACLSAAGVGGRERGKRSSRT